MFVHLPQTDLAGHSQGWMSSAYLDAVAGADRAVGRVLAALPAGTTVIVTADHGGHDWTHGTQHGGGHDRSPGSWPDPRVAARTLSYAGRDHGHRRHRGLGARDQPLAGERPAGRCWKPSSRAAVRHPAGHDARRRPRSAPSLVFPLVALHRTASSSRSRFSSSGRRWNTALALSQARLSMAG